MSKVLLVGIVILMIAGSCATKKTLPQPKTYKVLLNQQPYDFTVAFQDQEHKVVTSPVIKGSSLVLDAQPYDPQIFHAQRKLGKEKWFLSDHPGIAIQEITLAPYYSLYSYRVLMALQESGYDILYPACPLETKFLVVFIIGRAGIPWAGCVI